MTEIHARCHKNLKLIFLLKKQMIFKPPNFNIVPYNFMGEDIAHLHLQFYFLH
jgi:hypothetical protein